MEWFETIDGTSTHSATYLFAARSATCTFLQWGCAVRDEVKGKQVINHTQIVVLEDLARI